MYSPQKYFNCSPNLDSLFLLLNINEYSSLSSPALTFLQQQHKKKKEKESTLLWTRKIIVECGWSFNNVCVWLCVSAGMSHMKVNQYVKELLCCSVYACKSAFVCIVFVIIFEMRLKVGCCCVQAIWKNSYKNNNKQTKQKQKKNLFFFCHV